MKKTFRKKAALLLAAAMTATSITACGSGSPYADYETSAASWDSSSSVAPMANSLRMDKGYSAEGDYNNQYTVAETAAAMAPPYSPLSEEALVEDDISSIPLQENPISPSGGSAVSESGTGNFSPGEQKALQRKLIRTVSLDVETTEFDTLLPGIQQSVIKDGGYIEQSDVSGTSISAAADRKRYAFLVVRIPSSQLDAFLSQMSQQSNVINRSENVQDITLQYTDIESRKKSLTIEQERLWALLEKADTLEAVIALEERLSEIRYQLESFESQLRTYDNQVDYSTVHISIQEVGVFTPTIPDSLEARIQKGFIRNLESVINSLTDFLVWVISHLPALALLALILVFLWRIAKKIRSKRQDKNLPAKRPKFRKAKNPAKSPNNTPEERQDSLPVPEEQSPEKKDVTDL